MPPVIHRELWISFLHRCLAAGHFTRAGYAITVHFEVGGAITFAPALRQRDHNFTLVYAADGQTWVDRFKIEGFSLNEWRSLFKPRLSR